MSSNLQIKEQFSINDEIQQIANSNTALEEVLFRWITDSNRHLILCTGMDSQDKHTHVLVVLCEGGNDVAAFTIDLDSIRAKYPHLRPISSYITVASNDYGLELDDEDLQNYEVSLGAEFNNSLQQIIIPFANFIEYCMMYATDNVADVSISLRDARVLEEIVDRNDSYLLESKVLCASLNYSEPTPSARGFGEFVYSVMPWI